MKKLPKAIETRINLINSMLPQIETLDHFVYTYAGGTWPYKIDIMPISINGLKVTIQANNKNASTESYIKKETYNLSGINLMSDHIESLKYDLSVILKAFKKALN